MPRFSQQVLSALSNPQAGMLTGQAIANVGGRLAQIPENIRAEQQKKAQQAALQQGMLGYASQDPAALAEAAQAAAASGDSALAFNLASQSKELTGSKKLQNAQGSLSYLQNQMQSVLKDSSLSPTAQQNKLNQLQESANAIGRSVPGLDPMAVGGLSMKVENAVFQQQEAKRQSERADESLNLRFKSFGLQEDQARMAAEKHTEWTNTANYRTTLREIEMGEAQYKQALQLARGLSTVEGGREKFIQAHPDKAGVFDAITREQETKDLQLETLRENKEAGKFDYTDKQLLEFLDVPENATEEQKQAVEQTVKTIQQVAKMNPRQANKILESYVSKKLIGREIPSAAMAGLFKDAALSYVKTIDLPGFDSDEKEEALAAKLALRAADEYVNGVPLDQAMLSFSAETQTKKEDDNGIADLRKAAEKWKASQMQATDSE